MTRLAAVIRKGGFKLTTVRRVGRVAIYRQHLPGCNPATDSYEVVPPPIRNTNHNGQPVEPYETYPSAESWGKKGWTFTSLGKAAEKLGKLQKLAQKASCAGTVSRRNRFDGRRSRQSGNLQAEPFPSHWRTAISSGDRSSNTGRSAAGRRLLSPDRVIHAYRQFPATQRMHSQQTQSQSIQGMLQRVKE